MLRSLLGIAFLIFGLAACSSGGNTAPTVPSSEFAGRTPTATSLPTPTVSVQPTTVSEPIITPTLDWDQERAQRVELAGRLLVEASSIATEARRFEGGDNRALQETARLYVPVYLASMCIDGKEPSVDDYRLFTNNAISKRRLVEIEAKRVIRTIITAVDSWNDQSLDAATQHCLQPYLYPESLSDAKPAVDLYLASVLPSQPPLTKGGFESKVKESAGGWFSQSDQQEPYISWLCGDQC